MPKVIFDTNAYRNFVYGKTLEESIGDVRKLKDLEAVNNIEVLQSSIVLSEMLKHLVHKDRGGYEECKKGVVIASIHCRVLEEDRYTFSYLPTWNNVMRYEIDHKSLDDPKIMDHEISVGVVAHDISIDPTETFIDSIQGPLEINRKNIILTKRNLYHALLNGIKYINPGYDFKDFLAGDKTTRKKLVKFISSPDFNTYLSYLFLENVNKEFNLGVDLSDKIIIAFSEKYQPVIELHRRLYMKIINKIDIKDEDHMEFNTYYDAFIVAGSLLYDNAIFITNEKLLMECFNSVGLSDRIMTLDQYLNMVGWSKK